MTDLGFRKGMEVVKILHGLDGYREATLGTVTRVSKGVAYFEDETGITYDAKTGKELENFIAGFTSDITPLYS